MSNFEANDLEIDLDLLEQTASTVSSGSSSC